MIPGEGGESYAFTATAELDGCEYLLRLFNDDHETIAESPPVSLHVHESGEPDLSQQIITTIDEEAGALVVSVDPDDRTVQMSTAELADSADRWASTGELRPVTVTDTRVDAPGWQVSGHSGDFAGDAGEVDARYGLGAPGPGPGRRAAGAARRAGAARVRLR